MRKFCAVARRLVVPPHRDGGQAQFVTAPVPAQDTHPLSALFPWVIERLDRPLTVEDLARRARMSSRNLGRHLRSVTGATPLQWLLAQRIRHAQELLETTDDSVDSIAAATGMGTATTLRRRFNRTVGVPPDAYRRTFRSDPFTYPLRPDRQRAGHRPAPLGRSGGAPPAGRQAGAPRVAARRRWRADAASATRMPAAAYTASTHSGPVVWWAPK